MWPRILIRRVMYIRPLKLRKKGGPNARFFTRQPSLTYRNRPQLPFLSVPVASNQQFRYLTTERKRWLMHEIYLGFKYTVGIWGVTACLLVIYYLLLLEWLERKYPSPHEWWFISRMRFKLMIWAPHRNDAPMVDYVQIGGLAKNLIQRLEDESIDGAGLKDLVDGLWIDGVKSAYDITSKSEPWRRGYYTTLMMAAKAAEQTFGYLLDKKSGYVFPGNQVKGPSNPFPKPIPHGSPSAPHEKDCEIFMDPPETFYLKILTTKGFTSKQKMDAALDYASWLDFKGMIDASGAMYAWALQLATENTPPDELPIDRETHVLLENGRPPSTNMLTSLTTLAVHKARCGDVSSALPILISILRARRSLPNPVSKVHGSLTEELAADEAKASWTFAGFMSGINSIIHEFPYPPPPDDGESPPVRDAKEICEEAGLNVYIGEILYASKAAASSREAGLDWTREAVDIAEEQLHKVTNEGGDNDAAKKCKECLSTGLENWAQMVARLAKEEKEKQDKSKSSWLGGLWGQASSAQETGRWAAEENVVKERTKRAQGVLDDLEVPPSGILGWFSA